MADTNLKTVFLFCCRKNYIKNLAPNRRNQKETNINKIKILSPNFHFCEKNAVVGLGLLHQLQFLSGKKKKKEKKKEHCILSDIT